MKNKLISFILALCLLVAIPLSARYKYNPFTRKLDYYEPASDVDLGDIGDITLTGLATGNILYYNGTAWVNLATGANAEVLTLAGGVPTWAAAGAPAAHAASHEVGGADLVDHDQLTNWVANKHIDWTAAADNFSTSEDFFLAWTEAADHASITQTAVAGTATVPLINIDDDRTGGTADTVGEATIVMNAAGTYAFYIQTGQAYFGTDTTQIEDVIIIWADAADHMRIVQGNATGIEGQALIYINDDRVGTTANEADEATLHMTSEGPDSWAIYADIGKAQFDGDFILDYGSDIDNVSITQTAIAGIEDVPLIFIDDDRTGDTASEVGEASLVINAEGAYAFYVAQGNASFAERIYVDGRAYLNASAYIDDDGWLRWGTGDDFSIKWDTNGAGDDLLLLFTASMAGANETAALFISNLDPTAMTDHDNYLSPTLIITNDEGADANDYSGVVIGERAQADVKVTHYFDFYAMTGASDGSVVSADELPAIFRFGPNGTGVPGWATTGGDVLMEGSLEVDGDTHTAGYRRSAMLYWQESFDHGIAANRYSQMWDTSSLNTQGSGTNTIDTTPSRITLTTDNNAIGDNEGTITFFPVIVRARQNRSAFGVDLGQTANTQYYCGWNTSQTNAMVAAADEYVIVFYDASDNANWQIKVGDGTTEDVFTSAVAVTTNHICHQIWVETDGTVHWAINHVEVDITGTVDNLMTASNHYLIIGQAQSVTGAVVIVAEIDFVENEKTKDH